jgi:hypothetical protein
MTFRFYVSFNYLKIEIGKISKEFNQIINNSWNFIYILKMITILIFGNLSMILQILILTFF